MYVGVMSVGRWQGIIAIVMAYAVMLILVSPVVPSPLTTLRSKQSIQPPHFVVPVTALLLTAAVDAARTFWLMEKPAHSLTSGSDVVDLTTARLC
jgi:hypothetical protein